MSNGAEHKARKRFGQNFLNDLNIIKKIIASINPNREDNIVEIGPGLGALTRPLLTRVDNMQAVELDRDLIPKLVKLPNSENLIVHETDALKFDFSKKSQLLCQSSPLRIVGNLPYNISTPLIFHLLNFADDIQDMHFMLQKEVVERLAAKSGNSNYGRLSVMVQSQCKVEHLFNVSKHCFTPAPKVESAIIRLTPYKQTPFNISSFENFERLVKQAFSQRRKTLRNNLKGLLDIDQIQSCGTDPSKRPQNLSIEEFINLSELI